jgi:Ankyrin repeats (many copies)
MLLTDPRVDPSASDNEAIREASANGHIEVVRILLDDERVDPSAQDNAALNSASAGNHGKIVKMLMIDDRVVSDVKICDVARKYRSQSIRASALGMGSKSFSNRSSSVLGRPNSFFSGSSSALKRIESSTSLGPRPASIDTFRQ